MSYSSFYVRFYDIRQKISLSLGLIWRVFSNRIYLMVILSWQVIAWLQAIFIYRQLTGNILILHYNVDFGIDLVASPDQIFLYPLFGLIVSLINLTILAILSRHRDFKILAHLLLSAAVFFEIFLSLALLAIYLINFR
jgi:hypothetical protein